MTDFEIPCGVRKILDVLEEKGFGAWLVGGCVRDHLMGRQPKDYDVATSAAVEQTIAAFEGFRVIETGVKHGTVTVLSEGMPVEVTTYRIDGCYSDGRHPDSVVFSDDIRQDLSRRDFTVNAMAYSPQRGFLDLFGGRNDLRSGVIRCVGDPSTRFGEDALRILRAMRFSSVLEFEIEPATGKAIHEGKELLSRIAVERITQELLGILSGKGAAEVLRSFSDVMAQVIPPCGAMFGFEQRNPHHDYDVWEHTVRVVSAAPPDRVLRLAALLHDIGKPECFTVDRNGVGHFYGHAAVSERIAREVFSKYIRTDRRTSDEVTLLVGHHDEQLIPDRKIIRRRLSKYGEETLRRLIALQKADCAGQSERSKESAGALDETEAILNELAGENACVTLQGLAIKGGDLMAMGIPKGPLVGRILNALLAEVCAETLPNTSDGLRRRAAELYDELNHDGDNNL